MHFLDENVERLGRSSFEVVVAFDNRLVNPGAALHIVRLDGEKLLEGVGGAVCFERPHFHFPETLATVLRFTTERLLGDERVGTDGTGVDLVSNQVTELEDVDHSDHDRVVEGLAGATIIEGRFTTGGAVLAVADPGVAAAFGFAGLAGAEFAVVTDEFHPVDLLGLGHEIPDDVFLDAVENRGGNLEAESLGSDAEVGLKNLSDVHPRWHAERVEADINRSSVR